MDKETYEKLRTQSGFSELPEILRIPVPHDRKRITDRPVALASLDDVAFAIQVLDGEVEALFGRLSALRRLYKMARMKGALGRDNAVVFLTSHQGE